MSFKNWIKKFKYHHAGGYYFDVNVTDYKRDVRKLQAFYCLLENGFGWRKCHFVNCFGANKKDFKAYYTHILPWLNKEIDAPL